MDKAKNCKVQNITTMQFMVTKFQHRVTLKLVCRSFIIKCIGIYITYCQKGSPIFVHQQYLLASQVSLTTNTISTFIPPNLLPLLFVKRFDYRSDFLLEGSISLDIFSPSRRGPPRTHVLRLSAPCRDFISF